LENFTESNEIYFYTQKEQTTANDARAKKKKKKQKQKKGK